MYQGLPDPSNIEDISGKVGIAKLEDLDDLLQIVS
jgi:hypothetical protein